MDITTYEQAVQELADAEADVAGDMGEEALEGAWYDVVRSVGDRCTPGVKREFYQHTLGFMPDNA